jgi:RNA-binding protein YlmH
MDKESVLRRVLKIEDRLFISRLLDKAVKTIRSGAITHSEFLDPYQRTIVETTLSDHQDLNPILDGGYPGAERVILVFCPDFVFVGENDYTTYLDKHPISVLNIEIKNAEKLTHRDYLGSLMGLGIKREKIGDILVKEDGCSIFAMSDIAEYIQYNLQKVGNAKARVSMGDMEDLDIPESKVMDIKTTVASLRLDCIASAGFGTSRTRMAEMIKGEKLQLNWEVTDNPSKQVKEGDTISFRGKGRIVLEEIGRTTKKGRTGVLIRKLV